MARLISCPRFTVWAGAVVVCSISGPFATLRVFGFPADIVFWAVAVAFGMTLWSGLSIWLASALGGTSALGGIGKFWRSAIQAAIFSIVYATLTWAFVLRFYVSTGNETVSYPVLVLNFFVVFFALSQIIAAAVVMLKPPETSENAFLSRLGGGTQAQLISVGSDDHNVIANTTGGREAIFMRFSDALAELSDMDGLQVHRSHWVCRNSIVSLHQCDGKLVLLLKNGSEVPVSRRYASAVRQACR